MAPLLQNIVHGVSLPPFITQQLYDTALETQPWKDGDVVISTFPKCGTTLTQNLVYQMLHGPIPADKKLAQVCPWHERNDSQPEDLPENRRVWKSHMPWSHIFKPPGVQIRYITMVRNMKDVCVSMYHHSRGIPKLGYDGDFADWDEKFFAGEVWFGPWERHVEGWYEASQADENKVLFLYYEDFLLDPARTVKQIATFLGVELSEERVRELVEISSFEYMKDDAQANYAEIPRTQGECAFMRKGISGDWKNYFSDEQTKRYDALLSKTIAKLHAEPWIPFLASQ